MFYRLYSARKIAENLRDFPNGQISTFHVDTITLKKAFSSRLIRQAVLLKFPKNFEFTRSSTSSDIITSGPSAFKKGYRINFAVEARNRLIFLVTLMIPVSTSALTTEGNMRKVKSEKIQINGRHVNSGIFRRESGLLQGFSRRSQELGRIG